MARVFLSYSRTDAEEAAERLRDLLMSSGHGVWRDREEMRGGLDWKEQIRKAVEAVHCVVVLLTPRGVESEFVEFEWREALRLGKRVIGLQILPCNVPEALRSRHYHTADDEASRLALLARDLSELDQELLSQRRLSEDIPTETITFVQKAIKAYHQHLRVLRERAANDIPQEPYKELYAFELADEQIFFGRDTDSKQLRRALLRNRLAVLHARSGAGKTSLLNAGLMPDLITAGYVPIYARAHTDPVDAIKRVVSSALPQKAPAELARLSLHQFLRISEEALGPESREIVIILDQFEEFFVIYQKNEQRDPFINTLAECYDDVTLRTRFLLSLRADYFSELASFQQWLPNIFHNEYRLPVMSRSQAKDAIIGPMKTVDPSVSYSQTLLEELLNDLDISGMELPHLQIICSQLYGERRDNQTEITLSDYERLGRAQGILGGYLSKTLLTFPADERRVADDILFELISSQSTKRILDRDKLLAAVRAQEIVVDRVLNRLVDARLLRRDKDTDENRTLYEMAHEYLVEEIKRRAAADPNKMSAKVAKELLQGAVNNWRQGILAPRAILDRLYNDRENLSTLTDEEMTCILLSAIDEGHESVEYWITRNPNASIRLLQPYVLNETYPMRMRGRIIVSFRYLQDTAVSSLATLLEHPQDSIRKRASQVLDVIKTNLKEQGKLIEDEQTLRALRLLEHEQFLRQSAEARGERWERKRINPLEERPRPKPKRESREDEQEQDDKLNMLLSPKARGYYKALRSDWETMRIAGVNLLAETGESAAVDVLIEQLKLDASLVVQEAIVTALQRIGTQEALEAVAIWEQSHFRS